MSENANISEMAANVLENTSGRGELYALPDGIAGWSWGAFALSWIWAIGNRTWLGLLAIVPGIGLIVRIMLGINGRKWAWQNKYWDSIEHFNRVQRRWSIWGGILLGVPVLGIVAALVIPKYQDSVVRKSLDSSLVYANQASAAVGTYIASHRALPRDLAEAGFAAPLPSGMQSATIDQQTGVLKMTLDVGSLKGDAFYLAPTLEADGKVTWRCLYGDVPRHLVAPQCVYDSADPLRLD